MVYAYLRVSTGKQDGANQRLGVDELAKRLNLTIDKLMNMLKPGDVLLAGEISRLGRSLFMVMRILEFCMNNSVKVYTAKDGYELGDNIQSKVLAFAFGLAAEIEREMISRRTKEALAKRKAEGVVLGRPVGKKSSHVKLTGREEEIQDMLDNGNSQVEISDLLHVNRNTLAKFIKDNGLEVGRTDTKKHVRRRCLLNGKEQEIQQLLCNGTSKVKIAKIYRTSTNTLNQFIADNSLIVYPRKPPERHYLLDGEEDRIQLMLDTGISQAEIAKTYGVSETTLWKFIKMKNLNTSGILNTAEEREAFQEFILERRKRMEESKKRDGDT